MATSRRYPIGCTLGLILGGLACQALAEPPAASPSNNNGIMTFPNVRVIHAPPAATEQKSAADASSIKAVIDPVTGELSEDTSQTAELFNTAAARTRTGILSTSGATTASTGESEQLIYGPNNAVGLMLGPEDMVSQVVHLDANGNLTQECVTGEDQAAHARHSHAAKDLIPQESPNDREAHIIGWQAGSGCSRPRCQQHGFFCSHHRHPKRQCTRRRVQ